MDAVGFNATNAGPTWSFTVSKIAIAPVQISVGGIAGYNPANTSLSLTSAVPTAWIAAVTGASWLTMNATNGTTPATITLAFNTAAFAAGTYTNNIEFSVGAVKVEVPVTVTVAALNITKMAADLQRPFIYALQPPALSGQNGQLLFINTTTANIDKALPVGINPVDLTINYGEGRLYIASWTENATYVVDLASQTLLAPLHLGTDVYKINAGKPGQIITEGEDQWIYANLINTADGSTITTGFFREGDGEFDPTGRYYYHGDNNISGAGITRYDMSANSFSSAGGAGGHYYYGSRNVVMSADGTRIFWTGAAYDANLNDLGSFGEEIYATTAHGDLALGGQHVFNSHNGQILYTWPFSSTVMAVSGDQQKVFLYNSTLNQMVIIPMSSIASVPGPGLNPTPANGAVINPPLPQVAWTVSPAALSYQVYLGANAAAVAAANTNSAIYLGTTTSNSFALSTSVNPSSTYFWRVDSVGFAGVTTGAVWSFTVSALTITPQTLSLTGVTGLPMLPQTISLAAPLTTAWNLTVAQPWMSVSASHGVTPSSVTLSFNTTNLTAGLYTNQLTFLANGITLQLPVTLQLFDLNASKLVADPNRNYIYALHPGSGNFADAFLLFLNADTGIVEKTIPIGINPTDMTVNRFEDRLYVSNWQHNQTRVVDLKTQSELSPIALGTDVYKINAGVAGRLVMEGEDQWVYASLINTANASTITSIMVREGDGEFDPTGRYYYHVDNNDSGAGITKYDMGNDTFMSMAGAGEHYYYGSRNLVVSLDGSRLFWTSAMYDANLTDLGVIGAEIYACSTNGSIAFGSQQAFDTTTKQVIYNLPVSSSVEAVDRLYQRFWYFNSTTHRIESIAMSALQMPSITQQPASNTVVGVGANVNLSVTAMGLNPLSYQWLLSETNLLGQTNYFLARNNIQTSQQGNYQVIVSNPYGAVTSAVAQVTVLVAPSVVRQPANQNVFAGQNLSLSVGESGSEPMSYQWYFQESAIPGFTDSSCGISDAQAANEGIYYVVISNAAGSVTSSIAMVRVLPAAPTILVQPASVTVMASSNATFHLFAIGSEPMSYQWLLNGTPIPGSGRGGVSTAQYSLNDVQSWNAGNYQVIVSNSVGSVTSSIASLAVAPVAPYFVQQPVGATLPAGTNLTLTALAQGSEPIGYQWLHHGTQIPGAYQTSLTLTNLAANASGDYALMAFNAMGVSTSLVASVIITAAPPVFVQLPDSISVPLGSLFSLNSLAVGSTPLRYQWYFNNNPLPAKTNSSIILSAATTNSAGGYFVIAANNFGSVTSSVAQVAINVPATLLAPLTNQIVTAGNDLTLAAQATGTGALSYSWQFNGATISSNTATITITNVQLSQSGYYNVTVANQYGSASSMCRISVSAPPSHIAAWGDDSGGQTDVPTNLDDAVMVAGGDYHTVALRQGGSLLAWGYDGDGQIDVPTNPLPFVSIASGASHNLAILENGSVVAWGRNDAGQCNVPGSVVSALAVAAGDSHSLALLASGKIVAWGDNSFGQTSVPYGLNPGDGIPGYPYPIPFPIYPIFPIYPYPIYPIYPIYPPDGGGSIIVGPGDGGIIVIALNSVSPTAAARAIAAGRNHSLALLSDCTVVGWGDNSFGQTTPPPGLSNVVAIAAGYIHSVALRSDGTVVAWGDNTFGQTNVPLGLSNVVAIAAGDFHTLALLKNGTVTGWGDDTFGQLDSPSNMVNILEIASGYYHGLALTPTIPVLQPHITPNGLVIQWNGTGVLQWAPTPAGPFTDVPCQRNCYTNLDMSAPAKFFRLRR